MTRSMSVAMVNRLVLIDLSAEFISCMALAVGAMDMLSLPGSAESWSSMKAFVDSTRYWKKTKLTL